MNTRSRLHVALSITLLLIFPLIFFAGYHGAETKYPWRQGYIPVEGGRIWYAVVGEGDNIPMIMLHGGPGGTSRYLFALDALAADRPLIIFDQLGSGKSFANLDTTEMTIENFVGQVQTLADSLHLEAFYLYGHSWGGSLALDYYLTHPERVRALILSSPLVSTPLWLKDADTLIARLPDSVQQVIASSLRNKDFDTREFELADQMYADSFLLRTHVPPIAYDTSPSHANWAIYEYMWGPSEFASTGTLRTYDRTGKLSEIDVPVLFITGEFDEARPSTIKRFSEMVPQGEFYRVPGAGHATMYDNPDDNIRVLMEFLKRQDRLN